MGRRTLAVPVLLAALATPATGGDGPVRAGRPAHPMADRSPIAALPIFRMGTAGRRGVMPIPRAVSAIEAGAASDRPRGRHHPAIPPFGSIHSGLDSGIGYGFPALYPTGGRVVSPHWRMPW